MPRVKRHAVTQPLTESYRLIPLTQGQNAIVDAADFKWLAQWNWQAQWNRSTRGFYAVRWGGIRMHREVLGCGPSEEGEHINHNTLDNRRDNLRKATCTQNNCNREAPNRTGLKGVSYRSDHRWNARIGLGRKRICLGTFNSPEEAAKAYDEAAQRLHGEFAHLNFPKEGAQ